MKGIRSFLVICLAAPLFAQQPNWCKNQPRPAYSKLERVPTVDGWFEVYKIRPGVFAIYESHQLEEVISYLILGADRALLFDTGMGISNIQAVVAGLTNLPVRVLNSHTHNDHVGDNWRFTDIYGMDTEFTRTNARGSKEDAQAELAPDEICGSLPAGFDVKAYATRPFHVAHWLHDGDQIDLGGRALKVIGTPGHTPDSIALLDEKNALLFTGDTFYAGPIYLYRPETDLDAYLASVQRLASLAPQLQLLLPAHKVTPRAGRWSVPFAHHRQENSRGEASENQALGQHRSIIPRRSSKRREIENRELLSKSHDVISAVHVDHLAGDAAAGVGGEEDTG